MEILKRHGLKCTFNLNSGLYAPEGTVYPQGQIHRRMSRSQCLALYGGSGMEVAVHGLTHPSFVGLEAPGVVREVLQDRLDLEASYGGIVRGLAYPFGTFDDTVVDALKHCGIVYARTVISTGRFDIPLDWLRLPATCHHDDPRLMELADAFLAPDSWDSPRLFYLWGHSYEFEEKNNWHVIEDFAAKVGGRADVWYATNIEVYDYVTAWRQLVFSADGSRVHNPSAMTLWLRAGEKNYTIYPGQTLCLT